jgi:hypothetical protein
MVLRRESRLSEYSQNYGISMRRWSYGARLEGALPAAIGSSDAQAKQLQAAGAAKVCRETASGARPEAVAPRDRSACRQVTRDLLDTLAQIGERGGG